MTEFGLPVTEGPVPRKIPTAMLFANGGKYAPYAPIGARVLVYIPSDLFYHLGLQETALSP
jgi:hypothetical protein